MDEFGLPLSGHSLLGTMRGGWESNPTSNTVSQLAAAEPL